MYRDHLLPYCPSLACFLSSEGAQGLSHQSFLSLACYNSPQVHSVVPGFNSFYNTEPMSSVPDLLGADLSTSGHLAAFLDQIDDWQLISPKMHIPLKDLVNAGLGGGAGIGRTSTLPFTVVRKVHNTFCSLYHREKTRRLASRGYHLSPSICV